MEADGAVTNTVEDPAAKATDTVPAVAPAVMGTVQVAEMAAPAGIVHVATEPAVVTAELVPATKVTAAPVKVAVMATARSVTAALSRVMVMVVVPVEGVTPAVALENVAVAV